MRFQKLCSVAVASFTALSAVNGLNIIVTNDDGFGTSNIRAMYKAVKALGHNVWIVAATSNESGTGGTVIFTNQANLTADTEFGIVKKGAPSVGQDPTDSNIWYYNGTPSACVQVGLDYVLPKFYNLTDADVDLVLSGPNFGWNLGPFLYTLSGTIGATYTAVERGIPAIGFSAGYSVQTPYFWTNTTTAAGLEDPATITGKLAANLAKTLIEKANGSRILPLGYGINVNIPYITSFTNDSCVDPPFIHTRITTGADVDRAVYNATSGLFKFGNIVSSGANTCINGDCSLPGETDILNSGCQSSVSVFTVDYDAPNCAGSTDIRGLLSPLVQTSGSSGLVGGLNGTSNSTTGNATVTTGAPPTSSTTAALTGSAGRVVGNMAVALIVVLGVFVIS